MMMYEGQINKNTKILVCVVVYDRKTTIANWIRAYRQSDQCGTKLAVIHNYDNDCPPDDQRRNIELCKPDYYIPRKNIGQDIGAFRDVIFGRLLQHVPWDVLIWHTDDLLPTTRDFLRLMIYRLSRWNVGLVGWWYQPPRFVRTVAFGIYRHVARRLMFFHTGDDRTDALTFENGPKNMCKQVMDMGYTYRMVIGPNWPDKDFVFGKDLYPWVWDSGTQIHNKSCNGWKCFRSEFCHYDYL